MNQDACLKVCQVWDRMNNFFCLNWCGEVGVACE